MRKAMVVLLTALLVAPIARAEPGQWCGTVPPRDETYTGDDPRVRLEKIDGTRTVVLVPPGYGTSGRSYPVVWLFHGGLSHEDCFLLNTDLLIFTEDQPDDWQAIVVMPDGGASSAWVDSRDGQLRDETRFLEIFIPAIDARYRTLPERAHRAIAGFSAGGFGAMHLAARYPDRFAAAAGISGVVEMKETDWFTGTIYGTGQYWYPAPSTSGWFGDPVTDVVWWRDVDPVSLAPNFGGTAVTIFTGNGIPCDERDLAELHTLFPFSALESKVREWAEHLSEALSRAGVAHTLAARPCGTHTYRWAEAGIHTWWDELFTLFGRPAPSSFDHRRAVDEFSVGAGRSGPILAGRRNSSTSPTPPAGGSASAARARRRSPPRPASRGVRPSG